MLNKSSSSCSKVDGELIRDNLERTPSEVRLRRGVPSETYTTSPFESPTSTNFDDDSHSTDSYSLLLPYT
uniref:Uncharacterized protein n=1 Tax=Glossina austeni TaxID=7395 RepID=A0A1A9UNJ9_GLOAU